MSVKPRSPRLWPRMKVRGRRRRALAAQRRQVVSVVPYARLESNANGTFTATALSEYEPGVMRISWTRVYDGFGRPVRKGRS